jgi:hypothetical protein
MGYAAGSREKPTLGVVAAESNATLESSLEQTVRAECTTRIQGLQNPKSTYAYTRARAHTARRRGSITLIYPRKTPSFRPKDG